MYVQETNIFTYEQKHVIQQIQAIKQKYGVLYQF